jgi:methylated-DNA-protein-cysteine methyltransferase-like protein
MPSPYKNDGVHFSEMIETPTTYQLIYATVRNIPKGRVATYGQIAELAGLPRQARLVGYALHSLPSRNTVPWHRVVNAQGKISLRSEGGAATVQAQRLKREGVRFNDRGVIEMGKYRWQA